MIVKKFDQLPKDEQEDFVEALLKFHQKPEDYVVRAAEFNPPTTGGPVRVEVTVRSIRTGAEVKFRSGHVSNWVLDFEHALRAKAFG